MSLAADLVGADIMSGDPGAVSLLARRMSHLAEDVNGMRDKFTARYLGGIWEGEAFEAFARTLEDVPQDLQKVGHSYSMASHALSSYSGALDRVQQAARELARQATDAESRVNVAEGDRARAQREVGLAKAARAQAADDPVAMQHAQRRLQLAVGAVTAAAARHRQATSELADVRSRAQHAVAVFRDDVRLCCQRLHDASEAGIQNTPLSAYNRHLADSPLGIVVSTVLSPITDVVDVFGHLAALARDLGDLEAWRGVFAFIGTAALLATVLLFAIGTGGLGIVALGAIGVGAAGMAYVIDKERVRRGEISDDVLVYDLVALGASFFGLGRAAGKFAPAAVKAIHAGSPAWRTRYVRYGESGRHLTRPQRIRELRETAAEAIVTQGPGEISDRAVDPVPPQPCVHPRSGLGASPVGVIRHVRPITPRPIVLTGGY